MTTTGYLFQDDREEGLPYTLFIDGLEPEEGEEPESLEIRCRTLWEFADVAVNLAADENLTVFPLKLGEPEHYAEVSTEAWSASEEGVDDEA